MAQSPAHGIGFMLIGLYINLILFGVTICQLWLLWTRFVRDPWGLKLVVLLVFAAEVANTVGACVSMSDWLVTHYGQPRYLGLITPSYIVSMFSGAIGAFIVQCFLAWRIHNLRRQWWLTAIIVSFAVSGLIGCIATMIGCAIFKEFDRLNVIQASILVWSSCIVVCDSMETIALYATLRRALTGFATTDRRIVELKNLILQTSVLTMVCDLCHLSLVAAEPDSNLHMMFNLVSPKVVSNALLSTLNARRSHQHEMWGQEGATQWNHAGGSPTLASSWRRQIKKWGGAWLQPRAAPHEKAEYGSTIPLPSLPSLRGPGEDAGEMAGAIHITTVRAQFRQRTPDHRSLQEDSFGFPVEEIKSDLDRATPQPKGEDEDMVFRLSPALPTPSRDTFTASDSAHGLT